MSEYKCKYCGHFCSNFVAHGFNLKFLPKWCYKCRKRWPLGTPEQWLSKHKKATRT